MGQRDQTEGIDIALNRFSFTDEDVEITLANAKEGTKEREEIPIPITQNNKKSSKKENAEFKLISKKINSFQKLLAEESYRDKKENFYFGLSKEAIRNYEALTITYNYKLKSNIKRNDIMRKVLENFLTKDLDTLMKDLENL